MPELDGAYIFADYVGGNVWSLVEKAGSPPTVTRILGEAGIAAFARDPSNGDILLLDYNDDRILRIARVTSFNDYFIILTETGIFVDLPTLTPAPGLLPYSVNLPFWSDYALKRRWFGIPDPASKMQFSADGSWTFPSGQIWVKLFEMETTRGDPSLTRRIETRLLVKNSDGAYGVSYRWNDAGTEAYLVDDAGQEFDLPVLVNGSPHTQKWRIPARSDCRTCHTPQAGHSLSFNTRQLDLNRTIEGHQGNQLALLDAAGYFSNGIGNSALPLRHLRPDETEYALEARVRSYLAVNCAYCHQPGGTAAPAQWDGRIQTPLFQSGVIRETAINHGGNPLKKLVLPSYPEHSILLHRIAGEAGFSRMPPLGTTELDHQATALLTDWISSSLPGRMSYDDWRVLVFGNLISPQGEPGADPDHDGATNRNEFLLGCPPLNGSGFFVPIVNIAPHGATVSFSLPPGRSGIVEISSNLTEWVTWNVPGNSGVPRADGQYLLTGTTEVPWRFFRVKVTEM